MACRDQLRQNAVVKQYYCDVDIAHLISYNEELAHKLTTEPADIIPLVGPTCPLSKLFSITHSVLCLV